tara:strand:- start:1147 stop:1725 length:579 start_codon:yes stop_codon:yes gene_type:complete
MKAVNTPPFKAIVVGASAGGLEALYKIFQNLPADFPLPILTVIHLPPNKPSVIADIMNDKCAMKVVEAYDKTVIEAGHIYFAPPNYHMQIESDFSVSLSTEAPVQFSRPSIDILFETAAEAYGEGLLGIILTGANSDGARGLKKIMQYGGSAIIQDPDEAEIDAMPKAAMNKCPQADVKKLEEIYFYIQKLT